MSNPTMEDYERAVTMLVHGPAGVGKSTFAVSGPAPRLLLDSENSSRWVRQKKKRWDPLTEAPPVYDGTWELCVVKMTSWAIAEKVLEWIVSGQHPFRSVSVDSISELQVKAMDDISSGKPMKMQDWGVLLQNMGGFLRTLRDIIDEGGQGIETMVLVSTSKKDGNGVLKPYLQGQLASQVPYLFDITAYLYVDQLANPQNGALEEHRVLFTGTHPEYEAKSRPSGFPPTLYDPNLETVLQILFPPVAPLQMEAPSQ